MKIEIDYEIEEQIVRGSLLESMSNMQNEINAMIEGDAVLESFQCEDLHDNLRCLLSMQEVSKYYTVHTDWPIIESYDVDVEAVQAKLHQAQRQQIREEITDLGIDEGAL